MTEGNRISSQPEAEALEQERDVIIPWPIVWACLLLIAFAVLAVLVADKGESAVDALMLGNPPHPPFYWVREPLWEIVAISNMLLVSNVTLGTVCAIAIVIAFTSKGKGRLFELALGPFPGQRTFNQSRLARAEVLIAVFAVIWLIRITLPRIIHRHAPIGVHSLPDGTIVGAIAFWGTAADLCSRRVLNIWWKRIITSLFVLSVSLSLFTAIYAGWDWPTDIVGSILLGAALLCAARWFIDAHN